MAERGQVFFIDDEPVMQVAVAQWLGLAGFAVTGFEAAGAALAALPPDFDGVLISDVKMPGMDGLELLARAQARDPDLPVVLVTGHGDVAMAVAAMRRGAYDFIEKPFEPERLVDTVARAVEKRRLVLENRRLRGRLAAPGLDARLIGTSAAIETLRREVLDLAQMAVPVLIRGETGTGKELVARCLHEFGPRAARPFVAVNCGAVPEAMFESEMFGHESGAFTGARERRIGRLEHAHRGTLLLDEIESMPLSLQVKVLRVLQDQVLERLGSNKAIAVDVRLVAAAKLDLQDAARQGRFREDLYFRLNVAELELPPLRHRRDDIPLLFATFARDAAERHRRPEPPTPDGLVADLLAHDWPGNVRELKNVAERFVLGLRGAGRFSFADAAPDPGAGSLPAQVEAFERRLIAQALRRHGGNVKAVIKALGVPRRTLNEKMQRYGIGRLDP